MTDLPIKIDAHSVQLMLRPSGLIDQNGLIKSNLSLEGPDGIRLNVPVSMFPFLSPDQPALVILSVTQIKPKLPVIETPQLLRPN